MDACSNTCLKARRSAGQQGGKGAKIPACSPLYPRPSAGQPLLQYMRYSASRLELAIRWRHSAAEFLHLLPRAKDKNGMRKFGSLSSLAAQARIPVHTAKDENATQLSNCARFSHGLQIWMLDKLAVFLLNHQLLIFARIHQKYGCIWWFQLQKSDLKFLLSCKLLWHNKANQEELVLGGFPCNSVKLDLLAKGNKYEVDFNTFFLSCEALYQHKILPCPNSDIFWHTFASVVCGFPREVKG